MFQLNYTLPHMTRITRILMVASVAAIALLAWACRPTDESNTLSTAETAITIEIRGLRDLPDDVRARTTMELALKVRQLPVSPNKVSVAQSLANLSTEGDFGRDTLQEVTTTLASAVGEQPVAAGKDGTPAGPYVALAQL